MSSHASGTDTTLSPDDAFGILGDETRIRILQKLGDADGPLSFTELRERVGIRQGAQFNYHLEKVVGHFVEKTERGYALRQAGRRVVQAVLSGAITDEPVVEPTAIDFDCRFCGESIEVGYRHGRVRMSCPGCGGTHRTAPDGPSPEWMADGTGNLSTLPLPPAGIRGRTAVAAMRAAATVTHLEAKSATSGVCPRCAGRVERSIASVCEDHDGAGGVCDHCDHRLAVRVRFGCTNCPYERESSPVMALLNDPAVLSFVAAHGLNTTDRGIEWGWDPREEVVSTDPFVARFTFTLDGDSLTLTVDDELNVVGTGRVPRDGG